jgi:hypothetical protein
VNVTVRSVKWDGHSTVATGDGVDENGAEVHFAGDWRPMAAIREAIEMGEEPTAEVPDWAVL